MFIINVIFIFFLFNQIFSFQLINKMIKMRRLILNDGYNTLPILLVFFLLHLDYLLTFIFKQCNLTLSLIELRITLNNLLLNHLIIKLNKPCYISIIRTWNIHQQFCHISLTIIIKI